MLFAFDRKKSDDKALQVAVVPATMREIAYSYHWARRDDERQLPRQSWEPQWRSLVELIIADPTVVGVNFGGNDISREVVFRVTFNRPRTDADTATLIEQLGEAWEEDMEVVGELPVVSWTAA